MSVAEIGGMFSEQGELSERIGRWRAHRASLIKEMHGPVILPAPVTFLFHAIPASAFGPREYRESWRAPKEQGGIPHHVPPQALGGRSRRYNADVYLITTEAGDGKYGYLQFFRSGIVEYADNHCFLQKDQGPSVILGLELEREMVYCYEDALMRLRQEGSTDPLFVGFALVGIAQKNFYATFSASHGEQSLISNDIFISPEIAVDVNELEDRPFQKALLPLADIMWQVAGRAGTPFKTQDGVWNPFGKYSR